MWKELLAERIREARETSGKTQNDISVALGISVQSISSWENGKALPSFKNLELFANLTNRDIEFFFVDSDAHNDIPEDERQVLAAFRMLNESGREHALAVLQSLSLNRKLMR